MEFVAYDDQYLHLLEKYFKHPDTPINNRNHKIFKTNLYNYDNGICGILIDNQEIVAVNTAIVVKEDNKISCKCTHRLHVRKDYSYLSAKFMDQYWDPLLYSWAHNKKIYNMYATVNVGNESVLFWMTKRHKKRKSHLQYVNNFGKDILNDKWYIYPYKVLEMYELQYIVYNDKFPYTSRDKEKIVDKTVIDYLNKSFNFIPEFGWRI